MGRRWRVWWVAGLLLLGGACRMIPELRLTDGFGRAASLPPHDEAALVWPAPPAHPRIRFVQAVSGPADVGWRNGWGPRLAGWLAGRTTEEELVRPTGVAVSDERLWVADPGASSLWLYDRRARRVRRIRRAGRQPLLAPVAVASGPHRRVFLADSSLAAVVVYEASGRMAMTTTAPAMRRPCGVAYDAARDRLYVADSQAHRVWVFTGAGEWLGAIGRRGTGAGEFNFPTHVAVDARGRLYVTDALGFRIEIFSPEGTLMGSFGRHGDASGDFASPKGLAVDGEGHVYVVDALFDAVQIFNGEGRLLLSFGRRGRGPGEFWMPNGIAIEGGRWLYVADAYNRRIQVFEYLHDDAVPRP